MEIFKDIPGWEGSYQVSTYGRTKSLERRVIGKNNSRRTLREKILKAGLNSGGYLSVVLHKDDGGKSINVHMLVAITFLNHGRNNRKIF